MNSQEIIAQWQLIVNRQRWTYFLAATAEYQPSQLYWLEFVANVN